jgi:hypothetical protein
MAALRARGLGLIAPDLDLLTALLATDVLGLGLADFYASWATFFKHGTILPALRKKIYDVHHTGYIPYGIHIIGLRAPIVRPYSLLASSIAILKL